MIDFQFSLWDSWQRFVKPLRVSSPFNSLYEIPESVVPEASAEVVFLSILFMRFKKQNTIFQIHIQQSFNSLYEIHNIP